MQNSLFSFENKPSKQFPLDSKVWKLHEHSSTIDEPLLTEESEFNFQIDIRQIFDDSRCLQDTSSMLINNYSVHSISQASQKQIDSQIFYENGNNLWNQYQYKSVF